MSASPCTKALQQVGAPGHLPRPDDADLIVKDGQTSITTTARPKSSCDQQQKSCGIHGDAIISIRR